MLITIDLEHRRFNSGRKDDQDASLNGELGLYSYRLRKVQGLDKVPDETCLAGIDLPISCLRVAKIAKDADRLKK